MIRHIVLFKFKNDLDEQGIQHIFEAIGDLKKSIPTIQHYSWGKYSSRENLNKGFMHGFCMEFRNEAERDAYLVHEAHQTLVQTVILPSLEVGLESVLAFDYHLN